MNDTIQTQLQHRTIREFTDQPVSDSTMRTLFEVAMCTPTSRGMQNASIIWVKDTEKQRQLAEINTQEYVGRAPVYLLFIADLARTAAVLEESSLSTAGAATMDVYTEAFTDACLMVQNVVVAAESLGLGTTILGGVLNDPNAVIKLLELPPLTFPVLGLILGHPNQEPQLKPRIPQELRVMVDRYEQPESWSAALADYDADMHTYYDLRNANRREDTFTDQIRTKYGSIREARAKIISDIVGQGFTLGMPYEKKEMIPQAALSDRCGAGAAAAGGRADRFQCADTQVK